jgi:hypothetical protein
LKDTFDSAMTGICASQPTGIDAKPKFQRIQDVRDCEFIEPVGLLAFARSGKNGHKPANTGLTASFDDCSIEAWGHDET